MITCCGLESQNLIHKSFLDQPERMETETKSRWRINNQLSGIKRGVIRLGTYVLVVGLLGSSSCCIVLIVIVIYHAAASADFYQVVLPSLQLLNRL